MKKIQFSQECVYFEHINKICFHAYTTEDIILCFASPKCLKRLNKNNISNNLENIFYSIKSKLYQRAKTKIAKQQFNNPMCNSITIR